MMWNESDWKAFSPNQKLGLNYIIVHLFIGYLGVCFLSLMYLSYETPVKMQITHDKILTETVNGRKYKQ